MLEEKISKDYIEAMKARDQIRSSTINFLRAQIKNVRIEKRTESVADADVLAVIKKQVKQRQDSIEQFKAGGRQDLVEKEEKELAILKSYLPAEVSKDELRKMVEAAISESGAKSVKDMGAVMKLTLAKAEGRADNKQVSELVKEVLAKL